MLTTALTAVSASSAPRSTVGSDGGIGDPSYRFVLDIAGATAGDVISEAVVDRDHGQTYWAATATVSGVQSSPDSSASSVAAFTSASAVTLSTNGKFTDALNLVSGASRST